MINVAVKWQTAIVGVLGFAGVCLTLLINASLARQAERRSIKQEVATIKVALATELRVIPIEMARLKKSLKVWIGTTKNLTNFQSRFFQFLFTTPTGKILGN